MSGKGSDRIRMYREVRRSKQNERVAYFDNLGCQWRYCTVLEHMIEAIAVVACREPRRVMGKHCDDCARIAERWDIVEHMNW